MAASKLMALNLCLVSFPQGPFLVSRSPASPRAARPNPASCLPTLDPSGKSRLEPPLHSKRRRAMNPLLMLRTPSSFSLNALLILMDFWLREREKNPPHFTALGWFLPSFSLPTQQPPAAGRGTHLPAPSVVFPVRAVSWVGWGGRKRGVKVCLHPTTAVGLLMVGGGVSTGQV